MMPGLALIVCSYNPRADHLDRTLAGIRAQRLPHPEWEFVVVDNRCDQPLADRVDVSWHPRAKIVREDTPGLNAARRRGLAETTAPVVVFADDDNILAPDYLAEALSIAERRPFLGAWGGSCIPEFETPPPSGHESLLQHLALREVRREIWSNQHVETCPFGAGLCVRRAVTEHYERQSALDPLRLSLGRKGASLGSGEDLDIALCAHQLGLGTGLFPSLALTHLIAARRLSPAYLRKLAIECLVAYHVVMAIHHRPSGLNKQRRGEAFALLQHRLLARFGLGRKPRRLVELAARRKALSILSERPVNLSS